MSDLAKTKDEMVAAYADLAKALKATHKTVNNFAAALSTADPTLAAELLRDLPRMPSFGDDLKNGKKGKKEKKEKDPNAPKRPPSAYLEYQNSVRDEIRARNKDMPYAEVLRKISAAWGAMPEQEKATWTKLTAQRTEQYEKVKAAYAETLASDPVKGAAPEVAAPKKRGRKSEADKKKEAEEQLKQIAAAVDTPSVSKDKKKKAVAAVPSPAKVAPVVESSSEVSSDSDSDASSSSDDEPAPVVVKGKKSKKITKVDEPAKKKSKH